MAMKSDGLSPRIDRRTLVSGLALLPAAGSLLSTPVRAPAMAVRNLATVQWLQGSPTAAESRPGTIGPISLGAKRTGERSAGNHMPLSSEEDKFVEVASASVPRIAEIIAAYPPEHRAGALELAGRRYMQAARKFGCTPAEIERWVAAIMRKLRIRVREIDEAGKL
jgi:hypothetical protein